jgi:hypothetical protein
MIGRSEDMRQKTISSKGIESQALGDELLLDVHDWKPHLTKTNAVKWADPELVPRFEPTFRGNKDEDAPDTISPKYTQVYEKNSFMVNMSKQIGHFDDDLYAYGDQDMPPDDEFIANVAQDIDDRVEKGRYAKSSSKRVQVANLGKPGERGLIEPITKTAHPEVDIDVILGMYILCSISIFTILCYIIS